MLLQIQAMALQALVCTAADDISRLSLRSLEGGSILYKVFLVELEFVLLTKLE